MIQTHPSIFEQTLTKSGVEQKRVVSVIKLNKKVVSVD